MVHIKRIFFFFFNVYLSVLGLSTGLQDLQSSLRQVGSSSLTRDRTQVLATEPAGKFPKNIFKRKKKSCELRKSSKFNYRIFVLRGWLLGNRT